MTCFYYKNGRCSLESSFSEPTLQHIKDYCNLNYVSCGILVDGVKREEEREGAFERRMDQEEREKIEKASLGFKRISID
jgi:hypothetical protein